MTRGARLALTLALLVASAGLLQAQAPFEKPAPEMALQDPSGQDINAIQAQAQAMMSMTDDELAGALRVVARFLQLREDQVQELKRLLEMRREAIRPLLEAIREREKKLRELLESGGAASDVGKLVIEIHQLYKQIAQAQKDFLSRFEALLDPEQRRRLGAIHLAARLQPLLPAFRALHLL